MLARVTSTDEDTRMPPEGKPLTEKEVAALRRWIVQGAKFQPHWAYENAPRPAVPEVKDQSWVKNPIDAFVLAKLEAKGLKPVGPAGKGELLRRLYYDLTGLPPSAKEVADFVADNSSDAYEKVVDKLLVLRDGRVQQFGSRAAIAGMITPSGRVEIEPATAANAAPGVVAPPAVRGVTA